MKHLVSFRLVGLFIATLALLPLFQAASPAEPREIAAEAFAARAASIVADRASNTPSKKDDANGTLEKLCCTVADQFHTNSSLKSVANTALVSSLIFLFFAACKALRI